MMKLSAVQEREYRESVRVLSKGLVRPTIGNPSLWRTVQWHLDRLSEIAGAGSPWAEDA